MTVQKQFSKLFRFCKYIQLQSQRLLRTEILALRTSNFNFLILLLLDVNTRKYFFLLIIPLTSMTNLQPLISLSM